MTAHVLGLFITIACVVFLLAGVVVHSTFSRGFKTIVIAVSASVTIVCYFSLIGLLGWPTPYPNSDEDLVLLQAIVEEPGKSGTSEGSIYLWVRANENRSVPRALSFPYSRDLHESITEALRRKESGKSQGVRIRGNARGSGPHRSFSMFDLYKPRLIDKDI